MGQHIKRVFLILLAILVVIPLGALRLKPVPDDRKPPEGTTTTVYRYDSKGNVIEKRTTGFSGDDVNWLERFTYKAFDENGNWTVREKTWQDIGFNSEAVQETEKRIITYY